MNEIAKAARYIVNHRRAMNEYARRSYFAMLARKIRMECR